MLQSKSKDILSEAGLIVDAPVNVWPVALIVIYFPLTAHIHEVLISLWSYFLFVFVLSINLLRSFLSFST